MNERIGSKTNKIITEQKIVAMIKTGRETLVGNGFFVKDELALSLFIMSKIKAITAGIKKNVPIVAPFAKSSIPITS